MKRIPIPAAICKGELKHIAAFLLVLIVVSLAGCRKASTRSDIEGVTDFTWHVGPIQAVGDLYISPNPANWEFIVSNDHRFSFKLGESNCSGTYTWTAMNADSAEVKFTIKAWNTPPGSTTTADKLKKIVQSARVCYLFKPPFIPLTTNWFFGATMALEFKGSAGSFTAYR